MSGYVYVEVDLPEEILASNSEGPLFKDSVYYELSFPKIVFLREPIFPYELAGKEYQYFPLTISKNMFHRADPRLGQLESYQQTEQFTYTPFAIEEPRISRRDTVIAPDMETPVEFSLTYTDTPIDFFGVRPYVGDVKTPCDIMLMDNPMVTVSDPNKQLVKVYLFPEDTTIIQEFIKLEPLCLKFLRIKILKLWRLIASMPKPNMEKSKIKNKKLPNHRI
jgi:hypothetical protein